jgi:hypothetical protein
MAPVQGRAAIGKIVALLSSVLAAGAGLPRVARAQTDTARVTYRTSEVVFIAAGRDQRLGVGDTIEILNDDGTTMAFAVVVSVAQRSASARLPADAAVRVGQLVRFHPRADAAPADSIALAPDSGGLAVIALAVADSGAGAAAPGYARPPPSRLRGGLAVEQYSSSSAGASALRTSVTVAALDLDVPLARGTEFLVRGSGRWRSGASQSLTGAESFQPLLYQAELRIAPSASWSASLGRFVPSSTLGLGYLDGARLEVRVAAAHRLGVVGGLVPKIEWLHSSSETKRGGIYWAFGNGGGRVDGSLLAAADWGAGERRRTEIGGQVFWRVAQRTTASVYTEVDLPVAGTPTDKTQLTTLYASLHSSLPAGFRATVSAESHEPIQIWNAALQPDTLVPLPGRIDGATLSLGHDVAGLALDISGGLLKRVGDANPALRGTLTLSRGAFFLTATGQRSDLMDFASAMVRVVLLQRALPFTLSLGVAASVSTTAGGAQSFRRYSLRPELSRYLGSGLFASLGGDFGSYAGQGTSWLHAGVSYRFR